MQSTLRIVEMSNTAIRHLSDATTSSQRGHESDGNEGTLRISKHSSITGTSSWDCSELYSGHTLGEYYPLAERHSMYSAD